MSRATPPSSGATDVITDEETRTFASLPESPADDFARLVQRRQAAEEVARRTRALRALSKARQLHCQTTLTDFPPHAAGDGLAQAMAFTHLPGQSRRRQEVRQTALAW